MQAQSFFGDPGNIGLLVGLILDAAFLAWRALSRVGRAARPADGTARPLAEGQVVFGIGVIIFACLAAFLYFRATFPH